MDEFRVVISSEGAYSLWPSERRLPAGWQAEGFVGSREACLEHIEHTWTDMRPRSLIDAMNARGTN